VDDEGANRLIDQPMRGPWTIWVNCELRECPYSELWLSESTFSILWKKYNLYILPF
jgi:hypothetical protein